MSPSAGGLTYMGSFSLKKTERVHVQEDSRTWDGRCSLLFHPTATGKSKINQMAKIS